MTTESAAAELNARSFTFRDRHGREWDVTLTLRSALRLSKVDFSPVLSGCVAFDPATLQMSEELLKGLYVDVNVLGFTVWNLIAPQAEKLGVGEDEFAESLDGQALSAVKEAFWGTLRDFFPQMATVLSQLEEIVTRGRTKLTTGIGQRIERMGREMNAEIEKVLAQLDRELPTESSTSSPTAA